MTIKSKSRSCGRMIRSLTGMPFAIAMRLGRMIVQKRLDYDIRVKFPDHFKCEVTNCGDGCCSYLDFVLIGERSVKFSEGVTFEDIQAKFSQIV